MNGTCLCIINHCLPTRTILVNIEFQSIFVMIGSRDYIEMTVSWTDLWTLHIYFQIGICEIIRIRGWRFSRSNLLLLISSVVSHSFVSIIWISRGTLHKTQITVPSYLFLFITVDTISLLILLKCFIIWHCPNQSRQTCWFLCTILFIWPTFSFLYSPPIYMSLTLLIIFSDFEQFSVMLKWFTFVCCVDFVVFNDRLESLLFSQANRRSI